MQRRSMMASAAVTLILVAGCGSRSSSPAREAGGRAPSPVSGNSLPAVGTPVLAVGPSRTLLVTSVESNPDGSDTKNGVLLRTATGNSVEVEPLPTEVPLEQVHLGAYGDSFLLSGVECHPASKADVESERGCGAREPVPVALLLRGDGTWSEIATPPDEALGGLFPISGLESAQFVTSTGILLGYDEASDEWTTQDSGVAQVEGACGFGTSSAVVGRLEVTAGMDHSLDGWPDLSVVTGEGREIELPRTGSASGEVVCGEADQTVAWVSWLSPSYVVDLLSGVTHELPPLTQGTSIGKGAANSDAHLAVPIYSHDGTKAGATSRLASIVPGDDADWKFTSWAFDSLPDVKAAVATDTAIVAVVARTDGETPQDPVVRYELVTWNP